MQYGQVVGWREGVKGEVERVNQASHNMTSKPTLIKSFGEIFGLCYYRVKSVKILQICKNGTSYDAVATFHYQDL